MKRLFTALVVVAGQLAFGAGVNFPRSSSLFSSDLKWRIRCTTEKNGDGGYSHRLWLRRLDDVGEVPVWISNRSCDVLLSDDSQRLAITDWAGSNVSEIWVMQLSVPTEAVPLKINNLAGIVQPGELSGHCYYEALEWTSGRLLIRIYGHTDDYPSHGFAYYLTVDVPSGDASLVRMDAAEPAPLPSARR